MITKTIKWSRFHEKTNFIHHWKTLIEIYTFIMFSTRYFKTGPSSIFQALVSYSWTSSNLSIVIRAIHHWKELFEIDTIRKKNWLTLDAAAPYIHIYIPRPSSFPLASLPFLLPLPPSLCATACALYRNMRSLGSETCSLSTSATPSTSRSALYEPKHARSLYILRQSVT